MSHITAIATHNDITIAIKQINLLAFVFAFGKIRTDGKENLIAAIEIAAAYDQEKAIVPEVCILFGDKLFRGNRTTKINAESFDAFQSFNYPALANIGIHIHYDYSAIDYTPRTELVSAFC